MIMIICFWVEMIIIISYEWFSWQYSFIKLRVCVHAQALFLCLKFNHFFRVFCSLSFNICHSLLPIFNNFGLIFFQIQSKSLLTTNFTTYLLTKFTTISANLSNISIRILLSWSIQTFIFSIQICDLRKLKWWCYIFSSLQHKKRLRINSKSIFHTKLHYSLTSSIIFFPFFMIF